MSDSDHDDTLGDPFEEPIKDDEESDIDDDSLIDEDEEDDMPVDEDEEDDDWDMDIDDEE